MPAEMPPVPDPSFRRSLLECYLTLATSEELSEWLRVIGQDSRGIVDEKRKRVREHTEYLTMPRDAFPAQTRQYLADYAVEHLTWICHELGLATDGTKDNLYRRIYREGGFREAWLPRVPAVVESFERQLILPFVEWYPVRTRGQRESDYYGAFDNEMVELFGEECVHPEYPVAHGSTLKIDFHLGRPQRPGVGVEFKRPTTNSELQRALGQMDQYLPAYGGNLIVVVIPDDLTRAQETLFTDALRAKGTTTVVKRTEPS